MYTTYNRKLGLYYWAFYIYTFTVLCCITNIIHSLNVLFSECYMTDCFFYLYRRMLLSLLNLSVSFREILFSFIDSLELLQLWTFSRLVTVSGSLKRFKSSVRQIYLFARGRWTRNGWVDDRKYWLHCHYPKEPRLTYDT